MGIYMNNDDIYNLAERDLATTLERIVEQVNETNTINKATRSNYDFNELGEKCEHYEKYIALFNEKQREFEQLQQELSEMRSFLNKCPHNIMVQHEQEDIDTILSSLNTSLEEIYKRKTANSDNFNPDDLNDFQIIYKL
tara:strand:- start:488 stop:904 length:417 start_codon:yes stop_codon:yes gene_type:complete